MEHSISLQPDVISKSLGQSLFATEIVYHETLDSTNSVAKALASEGAAEGIVVLAEEQTAGRGRMGRRWLSPKYVNLLFSLLLRPAINPEQIYALTMNLALAACDGIEEVSMLRPMIKWPNDLYAGGKKLATETSADPDITLRPGDAGQIGQAKMVMNLYVDDVVQSKYTIS